MRETRLSSRISQNNSVFLHRLPNELIVETFLFGFVSMHWTSTETIKYLNTITSVCSLWRNIALAVPKLWTSILHYCPQGPERRKTATARLEAYITRSKSSPIDVNMVLRNPRATVKPIIRILHANAHRLRRFDIVLDTPELAVDLFPLPPPLNHLCLLDIAVLDEILTPDPERSIRLFQQDGAPEHLEKLTIDGTTWWDTSTIPAHLLESIDLTTWLDWTGMTDLLIRCTNVKTIRMSCMTEPESVAHHGPISVLPHVVSIDIQDDVPLSFHRFISCPNLETLKITAFPTRGTAWTASPLGGESSAPKWPRLTSLVFYQQSLTPATLQPLLQANPTITNLSLTHSSGAQDLLYLLLLSRDEDSGTYREATDVFLPHLENLVLDRAALSNDDQIRGHSFGIALMGVMMKRPKLRVRTWVGEWVSSNVSPKIAEAEYGDRLEVFD